MENKENYTPEEVTRIIVHYRCLVNERDKIKNNDGNVLHLSDALKRYMDNVPEDLRKRWDSELEIEKLEWICSENRILD